MTQHTTDTTDPTSTSAESSASPSVYQQIRDLNQRYRNLVGYARQTQSAADNTVKQIEEAYLRERTAILNGRTRSNGHHDVTSRVG